MDSVHRLVYLAPIIFVACLLHGCDRPAATSLLSFSPDSNALNYLSGRFDSLGVWRGTAFQGIPPGRLETMIINCSENSVASSGYCKRWYWYTTGLSYSEDTVDQTYGSCTCSVASKNNKYCQSWTCKTLEISRDVCRFTQSCHTPANKSCDYRKECQESQTRASTQIHKQFETSSEEFAFVAPDGGLWGWWSHASLCIVLGDLQGSIKQQQKQISVNCKGQEWFRRAEHDESSCTCDTPDSTQLYCDKWSCEKAAPQGVDAGLLAFERQYPYADDLNVSTWEEHYECQPQDGNSCFEFSGTMRSWLGGAVSWCKCGGSQSCVCDRYSLPPMMPWWYYEKMCVIFLVLLVIASSCTGRHMRADFDNFAIRLCIVVDAVVAAVCFYALGLYGLITLCLPSLCVMYIVWMLPIEDKSKEAAPASFDLRALE